MIAVAILAAGRGTRMKSSLPKVLHSLGGRSLVERALQSSSEIELARRIVIVGYRGELVKRALEPVADLEFVEQSQQLGTGHAIQQLLPHLAGFTGDLLVLNADVPLLRSSTLKRLVQIHQENRNAATLLTAQILNPQGYGRVFCDHHNLLQEIVEDRDCSTAQKQNHRINAGIYCFRWPDLAQVLPKLMTANAQQEYYLTDAVSALKPAMVVDVEDNQEILGINDRKQLAAAYSILQTRIKDHWMAAGVTLVDPDSITIDETVHLEPDVVIEPQTHLRGNTLIQSGSRIGPGSLIQDSQVGQQATVLYSVIVNSVINAGAHIGPYDHLLDQSQLAVCSDWATTHC